MKSYFSATLLLSAFGTALAGTPVSNLSVTLRGKKYEIPDGVSTVQELQDRVSEASGVEPKQQGRVLFGGKSLSIADALSDIGVKDGDQLNLVPSTKKKSSSSATKMSASATAAAKAEAGADASMDSIMDGLKDSMAKAGIDTGKLNEMMEGLGGGSGEQPSMAESMEQMSSMMKSPMFQEMMSDPEKLEQSRQMILNNPMLKSMMAGMPGMEEILNDPVAWREAMQAAAQMYASMDSNDLMTSMMGGAGGAGGVPPGLFDGMSPDATSKLALDELDEED